MNFDTWFNNVGKPDPKIKSQPKISEYLDDGYLAADGHYYYPCRSCERETEVWDPEQFEPNMHYCGGSPSCCP